MLKLLTIGVVGLPLFAGCVIAPKPEKTVPVSNHAYQVDQLFVDPNGCTIYRFFDQGDYRYYIVGPNGAHMPPTTTTVTETDVVTVDGDGGSSHSGGHGGNKR
jgi:hypothetical protein